MVASSISLARLLLGSVRSQRLFLIATISLPLFPIQVLTTSLRYATIKVSAGMATTHSRQDSFVADKTDSHTDRQRTTLTYIFHENEGTERLWIHWHQHHHDE